MAKAVFLDRDETLNPDPGYINDPGLFMLYPWVARELKRLKDAGFLLVVVTNQSGIGRGLITPDSLALIHEKLNQLLMKESGIFIDEFAVCIHKPDDDCICRKPKPSLLLDSADRMGLDLQASYMIGDRPSDQEAGVRAGVKRSYLIQPGDESSFRMAIEEILSET